MSGQPTLRATVHLIDGNHRWREAGQLRRAWLGAYGAQQVPGFALDRDDGGVRVFPLAGRQAEVYVYALEGDDPLVRTCDEQVLLDTLPLPALELPCPASP